MPFPVSYAGKVEWKTTNISEEFIQMFNKCVIQILEEEEARNIFQNGNRFNFDGRGLFRLGRKALEGIAYGYVESSFEHNKFVVSYYINCWEFFALLAATWLAFLAPFVLKFHTHLFFKCLILAMIWVWASAICWVSVALSFRRLIHKAFDHCTGLTMWLHSDI